jgi:hypothetical protein
MLRRGALVGYLLAGPLLAGQAPAGPGARAAGTGDGAIHSQVDRIVAIVDDDPILASELERVVALALVPRLPDEDEPAYRRRVLGRLIEQRLRLHEVNRFGAPEVDSEEVDEQLRQITSELGGEAELERRLLGVGMSRADLREQLLMQLQVWSFVRERLGPRVFVDLESIRAYYEDRLLPELSRREPGGEPAPSRQIEPALPRFEDVQEQIRAVLVEQRLNEEIDRWTQELRREADVIDLLEREAQPLPELRDRRLPPQRE